MKAMARFAWGLGCLLAMTALDTFAATNVIQIYNFDFGVASPPQHVDPVINVGDTVQWQWANGNHSTTAVGGQLESWDSGVMSSPASFSHTFSNAGTFGYYCRVHGAAGGCGNGVAMSGHIIVIQPGSTAAHITSINRQGGDILISWVTDGLCKTDAVQRTTGAGDGSFTDDFADVYIVTNTAGTSTNFLDAGAATNFPAAYYRVREIP